MVWKQAGLGRRLENIVKKLYRWRSRKGKPFSKSSVAKVRSLILAVLLFFLSIGVPLVAARVSASTLIAQTQQNPLRLVEQGRALYEAGQFEEAATAWQQAT